MVIVVTVKMDKSSSEQLFWRFHELHVFCSALATAGMYRLHSRGRLWATILVGYVGCIGVATISDCIIPYVGEWLVQAHDPHVHAGFIEKWWLINPLAAAGIALAFFWPNTKFPHAAHVLLSIGASLFHMTMAMNDFSPVKLIALSAFLFFAVWVPCCTSDIVFPLLFSGKENPSDGG